jgi:hypothetical protein
MKSAALLRFTFLSCTLLITCPTIAHGKIYYDIDFSSPPHRVGKAPVTNSSPSTPSGIVFGKPIVVNSFGAMNSQPLLFNTEGNSPSFYYDQIRLDMDRGKGFYYTSFDVLTHNLINSRNNFTVLFDLPSVHNLRFGNNGMLNLFSRTDIPYMDNTLMHFEIMMDIKNDHAKVFMNSTLVYDNSLLLYRNRYHPNDYAFRSVRFSLGLSQSTSTQDNRTCVALDNIFIANHVVPEPGTMALLALGALALTRKRRK